MVGPEGVYVKIRSNRPCSDDAEQSCCSSGGVAVMMEQISFVHLVELWWPLNDPLDSTMAENPSQAISWRAGH